MRLSFALTSALSVGVAKAEKDTNYYRPGFVNPNTLNAMYWEDAKNVLQDLDQFESLHVMYHGCVTAQYGSSYSKMEHQDHGGEGGSMGCGATDGGDEYWYMGQTQCFVPQAVYSLYGVLKGNTQKGSACAKKTFINSFFTTYGVEAFASPLGVDTTYANSYCTVNEGNGEDNKQNEEHGEKYGYSGYTSYGMGCSAGKFVTGSFRGGFCDGNDYIETIDTLDSFNAELEALGCTQIYDSSSGYTYYEDEDGEEGIDDIEDFTTVDILKVSKSCDVKMYADHCADPHGLLKKYEKKLDRALNAEPLTWKSKAEIATNALSGILFLGACVLAFLTYRIKRNISAKPMMDKEIVPDEEAAPAVPGLGHEVKRFFTAIGSVFASIGTILAFKLGFGNHSSKQNTGPADDISEPYHVERIPSVAGSVTSHTSEGTEQVYDSSHPTATVELTERRSMANASASESGAEKEVESTSSHQVERVPSTVSVASKAESVAASVAASAAPAPTHPVERVPSTSSSAAPAPSIPVQRVPSIVSVAASVASKAESVAASVAASVAKSMAEAEARAQESIPEAPAQDGVDQFASFGDAPNANVKKGLFARLKKKFKRDRGTKTVGW